MSIEKGTVLIGRYRIRRLLGSGGMAHVYLAEDMRNGKSVAIKVLKRELNDDPEFVRRFETEARAASSLSYENIVKVLGVGEANGYRYMVQEYVDGISLKDMIRHYESPWIGALRFLCSFKLPCTPMHMMAALFTVTLNLKHDHLEIIRPWSLTLVLPERQPRIRLRKQAVAP